MLFPPEVPLTLCQPYHDPNDEPGAEPLKPDFFHFENRQDQLGREMLKRRYSLP